MEQQYLSHSAGETEQIAAAFAAGDAQDAPDFHAAMAQLAAQLRLLAETQAVSIKNIL